MKKFYKSFCYPYGDVITNGEIYVSDFNRYGLYGVEVKFTDNLDNAGFYCSFDYKILLRYLNIKFKNGVPIELINYK